MTTNPLLQLFGEKDPDADVNCAFCEWQGKHQDLIKEWYSSPRDSWRMLAGREGWEYKCPKCKSLHSTHWFMVS